MVCPMTNEEIKNIIFAMNNNKILGQNGYRAYFFNKSFGNNGRDVIHAIKHFFETSYLLKEVNDTTLAFMPKVSNTFTCHDFRHITCCNTIYISAYQRLLLIDSRESCQSSLTKLNWCSWKKSHSR